MNKTIYSGLFLAAGLLLSPVVLAQDMALDCAAGSQQCDEACAGERRWWLFKGKQFQECSTACEERLARQCSARANDNAGSPSEVGGSMAAEKRGEKVHPQGEQFGYEKNAKKTKDQRGKYFSAGHKCRTRKINVEREIEIGEEIEVGQEEEFSEQAEKVKLAKDKGKGKSKAGEEKK